MKMLTIARNSLRPSYFPVMAHKVLVRARHRTMSERDAAGMWAAERAEDMDAWGRRTDEALWNEALAFARGMKARAQPCIDELRAHGIDLGGGGSYELLYFLTRLRRPQTVLETGVAAGWSTTAFLSAIADNGVGHLYSSDFPYFRLPEPERFVGYIVPEELKRAWTLHVKGDRRNLDQILRPELVVNLVHYDSDKSRAGRVFFMRRIAKHVTPETVVVMDDINDNLFFRDYVKNRPQMRVFGYHGKYIGLLGA